ncbi:MFS general substrate transporter [Fomitopsis serialis]|uniref:MFS general substrate transporter n=1 Tax=Fomitopsis serialis TaxID=139415 RepID=UPI002008CC30|nr:MFS general substrate transporter [Neoantrodia serialis]KAH9936571.1 MFS general substrate transporter [Neoantrodia serialis]
MPSSETPSVTASPPAARKQLSSLSSARKLTLLVIFCLAQYIDSFNISALFAATPPISVDLDISNAVSVWTTSAYQLTFAAFLLTSGRLSDLYSPKYVFLAGAFIISFTSLGCAFVRAQVPLFLLRAFMGVGAALNIPSAMQIIVRMFPTPHVQSKAVAAFAGSAALGNVSGLIIGAALVSFASWPAVFYFITVICFLMGALVTVLLPFSRNHDNNTGSRLETLKKVDIVGVSLLTAALVLFVFAVTDGAAVGWAKAETLAPLVISVFLGVGFFVWEAHIPEERAAVPPKMWNYENFTIIVILGLQPRMWWASVQLLYSWFYQDALGWSTIYTAVHFLPVGLVSILFMAFTSFLQQRFRLKWVMLGGQLLVLSGTILLAFGGSAAKYWPFTFPGFCLGTAGTTIHRALRRYSAHIAATVGSILTASSQFGSAAGTAIITSIQTTVQQTHGGPNSFSGRAAGLWFIVGMTAAETLSLLFFMKNVVAPGRDRRKAAVEAAEAVEQVVDADEKITEEKRAVDKEETTAEDPVDYIE